jgi:hypothetical protein
MRGDSRMEEGVSNHFNFITEISQKSCSKNILSKKKANEMYIITVRKVKA